MSVRLEHDPGGWHHFDSVYTSSNALRTMVFDLHEDGVSAICERTTPTMLMNNHSENIADGKLCEVIVLIL